MDNLIFRTEDGFLYEDGKHFVLINHKEGGYRKDKLNKTDDFMFSNYEDNSVEERKLFGRMNEILRMVESFKEKVDE